MMIKNFKLYSQVLTKRGDDRAVSTLVIKNSVLADFGVYNCTARNSYGEHFQLIEVVRKGGCLNNILVYGSKKLFHLYCLHRQNNHPVVL